MFKYSAIAQGDLDLLFVSPKAYSKSIGYAAWCQFEKLHPQVTLWETVTPYFKKQNIHFYVNRCGFHIVEFYNSYHPDPNDPDGTPILMSHFYSSTNTDSDSYQDWTSPFTYDTHYDRHGWWYLRNWRFPLKISLCAPKHREGLPTPHLPPTGGYSSAILLFDNLTLMCGQHIQN